MKNGKCTKPKRLLSIFFAVLVAVSILPMSWLQASAATEKHPDAVTITVTDGKPCGIRVDTAAALAFIDFLVTAVGYVSLLLGILHR